MGLFIKCKGHDLWHQPPHPTDNSLGKHSLENYMSAGLGQAAPSAAGASILPRTDLRNEATTSRTRAEPLRAKQTRPQRSLLPPAGTSRLWMRAPGQMVPLALCSMVDTPGRCLQESSARRAVSCALLLPSRQLHPH